ncbi:MAG: zinc ribbon domain-containing protein [Gemmatimonadota bacterium]|nr:zinc ribbon domain-containing protein [Gemmatimonadota bacterium]
MMLLEAAAALLLGLGVLWMVFQPFLETGPQEPEFIEPLELEETQRGQALLALKEIEFDLETGKLSTADYQMLKSRYTTRALEAMRVEEGAATAAGADVEQLIADRVARLKAEGGVATAELAMTCTSCGPRPEADALWCSSCGKPLPGMRVCAICQSPVDGGAGFCAGCGAPIG